MSISEILDSLTVADAASEGGKTLNFTTALHQPQTQTKKEPSAASILLAERQRARESLPLDGDFIRLRVNKKSANSIDSHSVTDALLDRMVKADEEPVYFVAQPKGKQQMGPQYNGVVPLRKKREKEQKAEAYKDRLEERLVSKVHKHKHTHKNTHLQKNNYKHKLKLIIIIIIIIIMIIINITIYIHTYV
jgi:ABC-type lipoprotein release transport system permease subunit